MDDNNVQRYKEKVSIGFHLRGGLDRTPEPPSVTEKVAKILLDIKAISLSSKKPFKYTSGILSPIYTDCRLLISFPKERREIIKYYLDAIKSSKISVDVVAGTATAGIPWASWIADFFNLPMIYVRGKTKEHGKRNQVEGLIKKGQNVVVIEDLISTGTSSIETAKAIRSVGASAPYVFSIMTYGLKKAEDSFKQNNIKLISLTNFQTVVDTAQKHNYINIKDQKMLLEWVKDPDSWGKNMGFN